jgi:hypothetical protein
MSNLNTNIIQQSENQILKKRRINLVCILDNYGFYDVYLNFLFQYVQYLTTKVGEVL